MAKSICLFNHKGGVSKTTTTFNLGWTLADKGKKVLIVDLDSQCNLTGLVLGFDAATEENMEKFYASRDNLTMKPVVTALITGTSPEEFNRTENGSLYQTGNPNLFLLSGHLDVSELDSQISVALRIAAGVPATRNIPGNLPKILQDIADKNGIDYVIYDLRACLETSAFIVTRRHVDKKRLCAAAKTREDCQTVPQRSDGQRMGACTSSPAPCFWRRSEAQNRPA